MTAMTWWSPASTTDRGFRRIRRAGDVSAFEPSYAGCMTDEEKDSAKNPHTGLATGIGLGLALGAGLGLTLFDNLALGIGVGLSIGVAIGVALDSRATDQSD